MLFKHDYIETNLCLDSDDTQLLVSEISHGTAPRGTLRTGLVRSSYHLHYVYGGEALFDGASVSRGNVFLMDPDVPHRLEIISDEPFDQYWLEFTGSEAERLLAATELGTKSKIIRCDRIESFRELLYDAVYGEACQEMLGMKFTGLLIWLLSALKPSAAQSEKVLSRQELYVRSAVGFLHSDSAMRATMTEIAGYVGLTEKYLCKLFKAQLGISPMEYLSRRRISIAESLLRSPGYSIAEISQAVGFDDQTYFSRFFKKRRGLSPSDYRSKYSE